MSAVPCPTTSDYRLPAHRRRKIVNAIALTLSLAAMAFGLFWLIWILWDTIRLGVDGLSWALFTRVDAAAQRGVRRPARTRSSVRCSWWARDACRHADRHPRRHLSRRVRPARLARQRDALHQRHSAVGAVDRHRPVRLRADRRQTRSFCGWAGVVALALIVIPVVIRTTENMLLLIPHALREAAFALGTPKWKVIYSVTLRAARAGVVTGVLLALARIAGETAPLLFTALSNQFFTADLSEPMANLPVTIFKFAMSPFTNWQQMAWAGVFLITLGRAGAQHPRARAVPQETLERRTMDTSHVRATPPGTHQDASQGPELLLRQVPGAEEHQPRDRRDARSPRSSVRRVAASRRCCACSTACSSCIRSSAPKAQRRASTARTC